MSEVKTHWSVWVTIILTVLSMVSGVVVMMTRMDSRIDFLESRLNQVISLCCGEVHKSYFERRELAHAKEDGTGPKEASAKERIDW